jgi:hypothetical protein
LNPEPTSAKIMREVDRMPAPFRALVHEYGFVIVFEMRLEGYKDPEQLRPVLDAWRRRKEQERLDSVG